VKITSIKGHYVSIPLETPHCTATSAITHANQIIVEVHTDAGVVGCGTLHGRMAKQVLELLGELDTFLRGMDPLAHEVVWNKMFGATTTVTGNPAWHENRILYNATNRNALMAALAGVDIACWDIKGKAANLPVWRLLGGNRKEIFAYVTGGYYEFGHDPMQIADEVTEYVELGFKGVKIKIGGMDLATDVKRVEAARRAIGPDTFLMIDANCAYDLEQATNAIRAFEPFDIFWFEEPLHWYDSVRSLAGC